MATFIGVCHSGIVFKLVAPVVDKRDRVQQSKQGDTISTASSNRRLLLLIVEVSTVKSRWPEATMWCPATVGPHRNLVVTREVLYPACTR